MISKRLTALIICMGYIAWGAIVDAQGLPVIDQGISSLIFAVVALVIREES